MSPVSLRINVPACVSCEPGTACSGHIRIGMWVVPKIQVPFCDPSILGALSPSMNKRGLQCLEQPMCRANFSTET